MGLPDVSPVPKKDSMGMDYVPVHEGEDDGGPAIKLSPGKLQRTGVKAEPAIRRVIAVSIRASGTVQEDEHRQTVVALRFDAFLNELQHITTGAYVHKGEPLMRVYSATLSAAAAQYVPIFFRHGRPPGSARQRRKIFRTNNRRNRKPAKLADRHLARPRDFRGQAPWRRHGKEAAISCSACRSLRGVGACRCGE
jgi:Cu(I)/Ag(I) efflux system membrane fusion protein